MDALAVPALVVAEEVGESSKMIHGAAIGFTVFLVLLVLLFVVTRFNPDR